MLSGPQISCVLILCRSFFTPGRDIGSAVFRVWVLVQSGMHKNLNQHVMKEQRSAYKSYIEKITLNLLLNYPDQNISNQFKPKKLLSYIKSLRTDKTDVTPMRSDGQITADTKQNSNIELMLLALLIL
jgi:hypothetical protein